MVNEMKKKTAIIGATNDSSKYAYLAAQMLMEYGHPIVPLSIHGGDVMGEQIQDLKQKSHFPDIHTVTMYINPKHQKEWMEYILSLQPKRVIFNPGAENQLFIDQLEKTGTKAVEACTLVMLRTGQF